MKLTPTKLYWITRLDEIKCFLNNTAQLFCAFLIISSIAWAILHLRDTPVIWHMDNVELGKLALDDFNYPFHVCKIIFSISLVLMFLFNIIETLIPSEKDMIAILVVPKIINNEKVQDLPEKFLDLAYDWLNQLKPKIEPEEK